MDRTELPAIEFPRAIEFATDPSSHSCTTLAPDHLPVLYRTPQPLNDDLMPFFLLYHQQNINYGRYFWNWDHNRFIKEGLFDLARQSVSLQYAIVAFSALIYSIQCEPRMKRFTFLFYAKALQELQKAIGDDSIGSEVSVHTSVATILELASIEANPCT